MLSSKLFEEGQNFLELIRCWCAAIEKRITSTNARVDGLEGRVVTLEARIGDKARAAARGGEDDG